MRTLFLRCDVVQLLPMLFALGCGSQAAPLHQLEQPSDPIPELATDFDPQAVGVISGRVVWSGSLPEANGFRNAHMLLSDHAGEWDRKNPCFPRINAESKAVAQAVVFLRKVSPARSKAWDKPPARVVLHEDKLMIEQGGVPSSVGFVHVGDAVEMVSHHPSFDMLRAQGVAFFTLPIPDPDKAVQRRFTQTGLVELSSPTNRAWERSWLFVSEHPYWIQTDADGQFSLADVPEGHYELVCWMPSWKVERFERDPELLNVSRVWYRAPLQKSMAVEIVSGQKMDVVFQMGLTENK